MNPIRPDKLCMLVTVYHPYRWVAPLTRRLLDRFWPDHPPLHFCGLTSEEAGDLPHIPCPKPELPRVWADFALDAARQLQARGYEACYFLLEDHPPLAPCHQEHLNRTLPALLNELPASYVGLMGWDNRRFATRGGPISGSRRLMHLTAPQAPRFHLHPALFRMETLVACLENLAASERPNPWGFEKLNDKPGAALPEEFKNSCYQICGEELSVHRPSAARRMARKIERGFYHKAMNLFPLFQKFGCGMAFWDTLGFDDYFYDGPFPMFYSGVMARGKVSPNFLRYVASREGAPPEFAEIIEQARLQSR
jgi:hypothetical protein